jgi:hypothetical protein
MELRQLSDLPPIKELAVIINVGTKYVSTLALVSTIRYAAVPVLVIDCEFKDCSLEWFRSLLRRYDFHLLSAPLRTHGETLDRIFAEVNVERVLLVDSDVEVLTPEMIQSMRSMLATDDRMFGSGFLHPAGWLTTHYGTDFPLATGIGYYQQRPWMPFALLRVSPVRLALAKGRSFTHRIVLNEFPSSRLLSRLLWRRFRIGIFRKLRFSFLDPFRKPYNGVRPAYLFYDTGADIFECLTEHLGLQFGSVSPGLVPWSVKHLVGATRAVLNPTTRDSNSSIDEHPIIRERLLTEYGIEIP